jgi:hypothetical protein
MAATSETLDNLIAPRPSSKQEEQVRRLAFSDYELLLLSNSGERGESW